MYKSNELNWLEYLTGKTIYLFGAGKTGMIYLNKLKKMYYDVEGIIDNNVGLYGKNLEDIAIIPLSEFEFRNNSSTMIIITSVHEREIKEQLIAEGIFNFISVEQIDFGGGVEYYDSDYFEWQKKIGEFGARIKVKMFESYIKPTDTVIEFGAGGGYLLNNINAIEKIGIEINESARKYAKRFGINMVSHIDEIENERADVIISTSVLEHCEDPLGELRKLYKKLKKGGKIIFHVPNESCDTEYTRSEINNHLFTWNCLNIGNLFKAAGFFVESVEKIQEVWPVHYFEIAKEVSPELFTDLCRLGGRAFEENRCLIVVSK